MQKNIRIMNKTVDNIRACREDIDLTTMRSPSAHLPREIIVVTLTLLVYYSRCWQHLPDIIGH